MSYEYENAAADFQSREVANLNELSTLQNIRDMQHLDLNGNLIGMSLCHSAQPRDTNTFHSGARSVQPY